MDTSTATPTVLVLLPEALQARTGNQGSIVVAGRTILEIIDALDNAFVGLRFNLCHETGELRPFVNIFLDGENIRYLQGLDTPVFDRATIHILPSIRNCSALDEMGCP